MTFDKKEWSKQYYKKNKEKFNKNSKLYYKDNKDKLSEWHKNDYLHNRDIILERSKKWKDSNPNLQFKYHWKHLSKLSKFFDLSSMNYKHALQSWSISVKNKDKMCQVCNSKDNLISHHILHKLKYPQLSLNLNNGVTLCRYCHHEAHFGTNNIKF